MLNKLRKLYIITSSLVYLPFIVFIVYAFIENTRFSFSPGFNVAWDISPWAMPTHQISSIIVMAIPVASCIIFFIVYYYKFYISTITGRFTTIFCAVWVIINFLFLFGLRYEKFNFITSNVYTSNFKNVEIVFLSCYVRSIDAINIYIVISVLVFVGCLFSLSVKKIKVIK